jgi:hypothetical protein
LSDVKIHHGPAVAGMDEVQRPMAEQLRFVIAQQPDHRRIDEGKATVAVGPVEDVLRLLHDEAVVFGMHIEEQFRLFPLLQLRGELVHESGVVVFQPQGLRDGVEHPESRVGHEA